VSDTFRLAREKIGPQGARIRCSSCQTVFRVQAPEGGSPPTPPEARPSPVARPAPAPPAAARPPVARPAPAPAPAAPAAAKPLPPVACALIAEPDAELAKRLADFLNRWRIASEIVEDGGEALLHMFRCPPQLAVLGAGLPSMSAPKVAEIAKRSGELAGVKLIHVAIASEPPVSGYEADEALEPAICRPVSALLAKFGWREAVGGAARAPDRASLRPAAGAGGRPRRGRRRPLAAARPRRRSYLERSDIAAGAAGAHRRRPT
jgi:predicted Zn finger-like uncharacterized protein